MYDREALHLTEEQFARFEELMGPPIRWEAFPPALEGYRREVMERGLRPAEEIVADFIRGTGKLTGVDPRTYKRSS